MTTTATTTATATATKKPSAYQLAKTERLQADLDRIQAKCSTRTLTAEEVQNLLAEVEKNFLDITTKSSMTGVKVVVNGGSPWASAYKWGAESTFVALERFSTGWKVTNVNRGPIGAKQRRVKVEFPAGWAPDHTVLLRHILGSTLVS